MTPRDLNRVDGARYASDTRLALTADGWGLWVLFSGLEHKLDTTVNGARERVLSVRAAASKTHHQHENCFLGVAELLSPSRCSRSAGSNTDPRHATKPKGEEKASPRAFIHRLRTSRDFPEVRPPPPRTAVQWDSAVPVH